jgi:hypothetical protein
VSAGSSPITSPPFLHKHIRSKGPSLHPVSGASKVLFPSPTPARSNTNCIVAGRYPASGTGLPRCIKHFPDMPSSIPRWIRTGLHISVYFPCPASAFPEYWAGRLPQLYFRGLLKVHSRYGLPVCSHPYGVLLSPELQPSGLPVRLSG